MSLKTKLIISARTPPDRGAGKLFAHAGKFSEKNPLTVIEFGVTRAQGAPVFFVKDSGAGLNKGMTVYFTLG